VRFIVEVNVFVGVRVILGDGVTTWVCVWVGEVTEVCVEVRDSVTVDVTVEAAVIVRVLVRVGLWVGVRVSVPVAPQVGAALVGVRVFVWIADGLVVTIRVVGIKVPVVANTRSVAVGVGEVCVAECTGGGE